MFWQDKSVEKQARNTLKKQVGEYLKIGGEYVKDKC